jgi:hypothetical protein
VAAERNAASDNFFPPVKIVNLRKVFGLHAFADKFSEYDDDDVKVAVRNLSLTLQEGKL